MRRRPPWSPVGHRATLHDPARESSAHGLFGELLYVLAPTRDAASVRSSRETRRHPTDFDARGSAPAEGDDHA